MNSATSKAFDKNRFLIEFIKKLKSGELVEPLDMCGWDIREVRAVAFAIELGALAGCAVTGQDGLVEAAGLVRLNASTDEYLASLKVKTRKGKAHAVSKALAKWTIAAIASVLAAVAIAWILKKLGLKG